MLKDSIFILQIILVLKRTHSLDTYTNDGRFYRTESGLTDVPDDIPDDALQVDLGHNNITQLKQNTFSQLHQCTHLNLWWNSISGVEAGSFDGLHNLKELFLSHNRLTEIFYNMFVGLESLVNLHLDNNQIVNIKSGAFEGLHTLRELWISSNALSVLKANMFHGLGNLLVFNAWKNKITAIEWGTFEELANLRELRLSENEVKELKSETFTGLEKLAELHMGWNKITKVENNAFSSLSNLSVLNLRYNKLRVLSADTFTGLNNLKTLILNDNDLVTLAATVLRDLPRPLQLSLGGNPLQCDCSLCWLRREEQEGTIVWNSLPGAEPECQGETQWVKWTCPGSDVNCTDPGHTQNGTRQGNAPFTCNSNVTYSCITGYWLAGASVITCGSDGQWDAEVPKCVRKRNTVVVSTSVSPSESGDSPDQGKEPLGRTRWIAIMVVVAVTSSIVSVIITASVMVCCCRGQK